VMAVLLRLETAFLVGLVVLVIFKALFSGG
jgi:hypothetical protein